MSLRAGVISINLQASTAQFMLDMDKAGVKIREFGGHTVSSMQASSAAIRTLEGSLPIRAVERFIATTLGMGPALQAAFPVVGAVVFAGVLTEVAEKAYKFFKEMRDAPEKISGAWRSLNAPMRATNDELRVANDRLENEIAKLEGRHQNTLKLLLDEARVAADHLADALNKDLANLNKLLAENNVSIVHRIMGIGGTTDIKELMGGESGVGGVAGRLATILDEGNRKIAAAKDGKTADAARTLAMAAANHELAAALEQVNKKLAEREGLQHARQTGFLPNGQPGPTWASDQGPGIEELKGVQRALLKAQDYIPLSLTNTDLTKRRDADVANKDNARQERPFDNKLAELRAQLKGVQGELAAVGQSHTAEVLAKSFAAADEAITRINDSLKRLNVAGISPDQVAQLRDYFRQIGEGKDQLEWQTKIEVTTKKINDEILAQNLLTAAIGKGYAAVRQAHIEAETMREVGPTRYTDAASAGDVGRVRTSVGARVDAEAAEQSAQAVLRLREQIDLERELAAAQAQGAEAVRQATLAVKLRVLATVLGTEEYAKQAAALRELFNAERANAVAADVAKINERIAATQRLTAAILGGAEAERQAALENKYAEIRRGGDTAVPGVIGMGTKEMAARSEDAGARQGELLAAGLRPALAVYNQIKEVNLEIAAIEARITADKGANLYEEIALRDLENQRLKLLAEQSLQLRGAQDGVRAFFLEMQEDAKSSASIINEALHSSFDEATSNMAKYFTGQKTEWAKGFQQMGDKMMESSIKSAAQKGLGALGEHFAPAKKFADALGLNKPDGSAENKALWVRFAGARVSAPGLPSADVIRGTFGGGDQGGGIFSAVGGALRAKPSALGGDLGFLGSMVSQVGSAYASVKGAGVLNKMAAPGAIAQDASDFGMTQPMYGGGRAEGGGVEPGVAYRVNENEQEYYIPSARGTVVPHPGGGGGGNRFHFHYTIDARGADLGAQNRIARGIEASHRAAVATAVQATAERAKRVPKG